MKTKHKQNVIDILGRKPIHPFPARMAPGIALDALGETKDMLRVLDPMAGSGTVLAVASANGHQVFGVDLDPLAVILSSVWTRPIDGKRTRETAREVLERARKQFRSLRSGKAYPANSDDETRKFIRYWFDDYARRQLTALSAEILRVHDRAQRDALWCAYSRLIITKQAGASLAMDLSHSRPHRKFKHAPIKPFNRFLTATETVIANCPQAEGTPHGPVAEVWCGDARTLAIEDESIDLVLTSPPYLNAIDYLRCSKFSLVWMGYTVSELRRIRGDSVGVEASSEEASGSEWVAAIIKRLKLRPVLSDRNYALLARYVWDIGRALSESSRVLRRGGRAVYVVGDSTIRGTFIRNSMIVTMVAQRNGLSLHSRQCRSLPANRRYLPAPKPGPSTAAMDTRMRREVVLAFGKP